MRLDLAASAGGTVWIQSKDEQGQGDSRRGSKEQGQGSRGSLHSVGLESQGSPGSRRSQSRPSMLAVTVHRLKVIRRSQS